MRRSGPSVRARPVAVPARVATAAPRGQLLGGATKEVDWMFTVSASLCATAILPSSVAEGTSGGRRRDFGTLLLGRQREGGLCATYTNRADDSLGRRGRRCLAGSVRKRRRGTNAAHLSIRRLSIPWG